MDIEILSGRKFAIKCKPKDVTEIKDGSKITAIEILYNGNKFTFKINYYACLNIEGKQEKFLIKEIKTSMNPDYLYIIFSSVLTKAYHILLPCISGSFINFNANGYLNNIYYDSEKKEISLLYRDNLKQCKDTYEHLLRNRFYKSDTELPYDHRLFILGLPTNRDIEEKCYLEGRYSDLPDTYKKRIIEFFGLSKDEELYQVLYKDDKLRKKMEKELWVEIPKGTELMSKPFSHEEIFNVKMLELFKYENTTNINPADS